jgi:hypothetical protein
MRADVDDPAPVEYRDAVGQRQRRPPVCDQQRGAVLGDGPERVVDGGFRGRVHRGRRVVQHQHAGVRQQRPRERHPLPLTAGQREAALADHRVVAVGQLGDERVGLCGPRRRRDLLVGRVRAAVGDVGAHGVREEERLLEHHADRAAQRRQPQLADVHARHRDRALVHVVEAGQQQ